LIALPVIPFTVQEEMNGAKRRFEYHERCIFCDIIRHELELQSRVVAAGEHFVALSPYASRFPFETWILPRRHLSHYEHTDNSLMPNLAWVVKSVLKRLDKVLEKPAFNFVIHTAPVQEAPMAHYHWHIEIIPKLTRVAGFEWGTGFYINPAAPEESAQFLRDARV
jgi:UDPglucose--hexose-1-phosphate uridylyltransferase